MNKYGKRRKTRVKEGSENKGGNIELDLVDFAHCIFHKIGLCI